MLEHLCAIIGDESAGEPQLNRRQKKDLREIRV